MEDDEWAITIDTRAADLAQNAAGATLRAEAARLREARPVATRVARLLGVHTDEAAWRKGSKGEEKVAAQLAKLGSSWRVLHSIPVGDRGSDIDHVVIGPAGVFSVNTKSHVDARVWVRGDAFLVNGKHHPYVRNSRYEAQRAGRMLSAACGFAVSVHPIVAVYGATEGFTIKEQPDGVSVIARREITGWLKRQPAVIAPEVVDSIYRVARHPKTWTSRPGNL